MVVQNNRFWALLALLALVCCLSCCGITPAQGKAIAPATNAHARLFEALQPGRISIARKAAGRNSSALPILGISQGYILHQSPYRLSKEFAAVAATEGGVCETIQKYLPSGCTVSANCMDISCQVNFLDLDTFTIQLDISPCVDPVYAEFVFHDSKLGISYKKKIEGDIRFGIPGVSISIPLVGKGGLYAVIDVGGSTDAVVLSVGFQACAEILDHSECYPSAPYVVFSTKVDYKGICDSMAAAAAVQRPKLFTLARN